MIGRIASWLRPTRPESSKLVNAYATHRDPPPLDFPHVLINRRDRRDPELSEHLQGFAGFVTDRGERSMTATRRAVLGHLERVQHHLAFMADETPQPALTAWARAANAILFTTDGAVRAPDGKVLVAPDTGDPEPGAEVPHPADAAARKAASEAALDARGVHVPRSLPSEISEIEVELRDPKEVAARCLALFVCALRGESVSADEPIPAEKLERRYPLAFDALSPAERAFMVSAEPPHQAVVDHVWRYEAAAALAWAVRVVEALPFPDAIVNVSALAETMVSLDEAAFVASAQLRPAGEILDALDLTFRLHWATVDARMKGVPPPAGLEPGVVKERHYALNWLTRFEHADWDDVTTPT